MSYFDTDEAYYNAALQTDEYVTERHNFLKETTERYVIDEDKIKHQIHKRIQELEYEQQRLEEYTEKKRNRYYKIIASDFKKWKTEND